MKITLTYYTLYNINGFIASVKSDMFEERFSYPYDNYADLEADVRYAIKNASTFDTLFCLDSLRAPAHPLLIHKISVKHLNKRYRKVAIYSLPNNQYCVKVRDYRGNKHYSKAFDNFATAKYIYKTISAFADFTNWSNARDDKIEKIIERRMQPNV